MRRIDEVQAEYDEFKLIYNGDVDCDAHNNQWHAKV